MRRENNCIMIILPILGGGTTRYASELFNAWSEQGYTVLYVEYLYRIVNIKVSDNLGVRNHSFIQDGSFEFLYEFTEKFHVGVIHINHMKYCTKELYDFYLKVNVPLVLTLHDYMCICPRINLINPDTKHYCGEKGERACNLCIKNDKSMNIDGSKIDSIQQYKKIFLKLLKKAWLITTPSFDTKKRIQNYFNTVKIEARYNPEIIKAQFKCKCVKKRLNNEIKVGLIGKMESHKGGDILNEVSQIAHETGAAIKFVLFGECGSNVKCSKGLGDTLTILGKYKESEVYARIASQEIDFFWFPIQCPETYSYTLSIPIKMGIPCISSDIGATAERIKNRGWGKVYPLEFSNKQILEELLNFNYVSVREKNNFFIENTSFGRPNDYYCLPFNKLEKIELDTSSILKYDKYNSIYKLNYEELRYYYKRSSSAVKTLIRIDPVEIVKKIINAIKNRC